MMNKDKHARKASIGLLARMAALLSPRRERSLTRSGQRTRTRAAEAGNVFFTLFGAVAVVGVLGAGIMSTMRGPLSTMVEVNRIEETKAVMRINARLILQDAEGASYCGATDDADVGGAREFLEAAPWDNATSNFPAGGGHMPLIGGTTTDPWGQRYGYCVWDNGDATGCAGNYLAGSSSTNSMNIALVSGGPDRTITTSCTDLASQTSNGDDIINPVESDDTGVTGSLLWTDNTTNIESAVPLDVGGDSTTTSTFGGGATFGNNLTTTGSVITDSIEPTSLDETGSIDISGTLTAGANNILNINDAVDITGALDVNGNITDDSDGTITLDDAALVTGSLDVTGATDLAGGLAVGGATNVFTVDGTTGNTVTSGSLDIAGNITDTGDNIVTIDDALDVTAGLNVNGGITNDNGTDPVSITDVEGLSITGPTTLGSTLTMNTVGAVDDTPVITITNTTPTSIFTLDEVGDLTIAGRLQSGGFNETLTIYGTTIDGSTKPLVITDGDTTPVEVFSVDTNGIITGTLAGGTTGQILMSNGTVFNPTSVSGDVAITSGLFEIQSNTINVNELNVGTPTDEQCLKADGTTGLKWQDCSAGASGGDGVGTTDTLANLLDNTNGDDAGNNDITNVNQMGADEYCTADLSTCITSADLTDPPASDRIEDGGTPDTYIDVDTSATTDGTPNSIVFFNAGALSMTIQNTGQVDVVGAATVGGQLDVTGTLTGGVDDSLTVDDALAVTGNLAVDTNVLFVDSTTNNNVGIGTASPVASAALDISSTTQGFLAPRLDAAEVAALTLTPPATGLLIFNEDAGDAGIFQFWDGDEWIDVGGGGAETGGLWTPDGTNDYIEYDDNLGGVRIGRVSSQPAPAIDWLFDVPNSVVYTTTNKVAIGSGTVSDNSGANTNVVLDLNGDIAAIEYCDADGATCFNAADIDTLISGGSTPTDRIEDGGDQNTYIDTDVGDADANNTIVFHNAGTQSMILDANGDVGIGVLSDPLTALQIDDTGYTFASGGLSFGDGDTGFYESADDVLNIVTVGSTRFIIDAGGNVGIGYGTAAPVARLDINGPVRLAQGTELCTALTEGMIRFVPGTNTYQVCADEANNWEDLFTTGSGASGLWTDLGGGRIHYGDDGTQQVGIGTNNPITTLDVNGGVRVGSVAGDAPDYLSMDGLSDVDANAPANGNILQYNNVSGNWESVAPSTVAGSTDLDDLNDVTVGTLSGGECLVYDNISGLWEGGSCAAAGSLDLDDLGDVVATGATQGQVIKFDGTNWVLGDDLGGDLLFNGNLVFSANSYGNWGTDGNSGGPGSSGGYNPITYLTSTRAVHGRRLAGDYLLTTYDFDGTDWTQVGNTYNGGSDGMYGDTFTALTATDIAAEYGNQLRRFTFDGTDWSPIGTGPTMAGGYATQLETLDSNTVAALSRNSELEVFSWNGSTWTKQGTTATVGSAEPDTASHAALDNNTVAVIRHDNDTITTYDWNGSTWSQVGNTFNSPDDIIDQSTVTNFGSTMIGVTYPTANMLRTYVWDGSDWSLESQDLTGLNNGYVGLSAIDGTTFVKTGEGDGFQQYTRTSGASTIVDNDSGGTLGGLFSVGNRLRVTGSSTNDGIYTVSGITDSDTLQVAETLFAAGPEAAQLSLIDSASTLNALVDVSVPSPSDGQCLIYDNASGTWQAGSCDQSGAVPTTLDDLSDVIAAGATQGQVIKFDGTNWVLGDDLGGDALFDGSLQFTLSAYGAWSADATHVIDASNHPQFSAMEVLSPDVVVIAKQSTNTIETWELTGSTWAQVGSSFTGFTEIGSIRSIGLLSSTDIAVYADDGGGYRIHRLRWDGSTWTSIGTSVVLSPCVCSYQVTALDSNTIVWGSANGPEADIFSWTGSQWILDANVNAGSSSNSFKALDNNTIATVTNTELSRYDWNGTSWVLVGTPLTITDMTALDTPSIARLSANMVAVDSSRSNDEIGTYLWNGSTWEPVGSILTTPFDGNNNMPIAGNESTLYSVRGVWSDSTLTKYTRTTGVSSIADAGGTNTLGGLVSVNDRIAVSGTSDNNGTYTVSGITDSDTITVSEIVTNEGPVDGMISLINSATLLDDLVDVSVPSPSDGQCLIYDNASGTWQAGACSSGTPTAGYEIIDGAANDDDTWVRVAADDGSDNDTIRFAAGGGTEHMRITSSGDVGIGTTTPASELDVTGDIRLTNHLRFAGVNGNAPTYTTPSLSLNDLTNLSVASPTNGQCLVFNTTGSVWEAGACGGGGAQDRIEDSGNQDTYIDVDTNDADGDNRIDFHTNGAEAMRITSGGDVGIGTTTPASKLDVTGDIGVSNYLKFAGVNGNAPTYNTLALNDLSNVTAGSPNTNDVLSWNGTAWVSAAASGGGGATYEIIDGTANDDDTWVRVAADDGSDNDTIRFAIDTDADDTADEIMRITNGGNIGIGTATPGNKLSVVGDVRSNRLILNGDSGSAPTYVLPSLALNDLSNVTAGSPNTNDVLSWNGAAWVAASGGGGGGAINDLSDGLTDAQSNLFLTHEGGVSLAADNENNVGIGANALSSLATSVDGFRGDKNVALGVDALRDTTTGYDNTAVGDSALQEMETGASNTAMGSNALSSSISDNNNTAIGNAALRYTNGGSDNTAIGQAAMRDNVSGSNNVAIGHDALFENQTGSANIVIGQEAALGSDGASDVIGNVIIGDKAARSILTNAHRNIIIGEEAASDLTTGEENVIIGAGNAVNNSGIGDTLTTGSNNILIGDSTVDVPANNTDDYLNIGNAIYGDLANNYIGIGNDSPDVALDVTGDIEYTGTITDVSDIRLKTDITPLDMDDMVSRLAQIDTYTFRMKDDESGQIEYGVMAQELEKVFPELVRTAKDEMGTKSVNYVGLIAPIIETTKALKSENDALKAEIAEIKTAQADILEQVKGLSRHTGYGFEKASTAMLLMVLMLLGGIGIGVVVRRKESGHTAE